MATFKLKLSKNGASAIAGVLISALIVVIAGYFTLQLSQDQIEQWRQENERQKIEQTRILQEQRRQAEQRRQEEATRQREIQRQRELEQARRDSERARQIAEAERRSNMVKESKIPKKVLVRYNTYKPFNSGVYEAIIRDVNLELKSPGGKVVALIWFGDIKEATTTDYLSQHSVNVTRKSNYDRPKLLKIYFRSANERDEFFNRLIAASNEWRQQYADAF